MKNFVLVLLLACSAVAYAQEVKTCWETLHTLSPGMANDYACVLDKAKDELDSLCTEGGIKLSKTLDNYLKFKAQYEAVQAQGRAWIEENPGASQIPRMIAADIQHAEIAWRIPGKRYEVDDLVEKIRRRSMGCK